MSQNPAAMPPYPPVTDEYGATEVTRPGDMNSEAFRVARNALIDAREGRAHYCPNSQECCDVCETHAGCRCGDEVEW